MTGAQFAPVAAPQSFNTTAELSEESVLLIAEAVRVGSQRGSEEGTDKGVQRANEQIKQLSDLETLTTY